MDGFIYLATPFIAGLIGSLFTVQAIDGWYATLNKPFFNPPNFVFAPVWTILYVLMAMSFYLVWVNRENKKKKIKKEGMRIFMAQLVLNVLWSVIFFGLHSPTLAAADIIVLLILIFVNIKVFAKVSKTASYLLYPYLAWVFFASILNVAIVALN